MQVKDVMIADAACCIFELALQEVAQRKLLNLEYLFD